MSKSLKFDPTLPGSIPKEVIDAAVTVAEWFDVKGLKEGSICGIGPVSNVRLDLSRRVVCAAIRAENGDVIVGIRHYSQDMHYQIRNRPDGHRFENRFGADQGFVNTWGEYLTREEAYVVAQHNNQIFRDTAFTREGKLDSEALY